MLDQNTDRMWYVIGAVIVGAAIIFLANGTLPSLFASVTESFDETSQSAMGMMGEPNPNLLTYTDRNLLLNHSDHTGVDGRGDNRNLTVMAQDANGEAYFSARSQSVMGNIYTDSRVRSIEPRVAGETYTVSFDVMTEQSGNWGFYFYTNSGHSLRDTGIRSTNGRWVRHSLTFIQRDDRNEPILFGFSHMEQGMEFGWRRLKLEKGPIATPWIP